MEIQFLHTENAVEYKLENTWKFFLLVPNVLAVYIEAFTVSLSYSSERRQLLGCLKKT